MTDFLTRVFDHLTATGYPYLGATWCDAVDGADITVWNDDAQNTAYLVCDGEPDAYAHTLGLIALLYAGLDEVQSLVAPDEWTGGYGVLVVPSVCPGWERIVHAARLASIQIWGFDGESGTSSVMTVLLE